MKFHRDAIDIPTDPAERRSLIKWVMHHPLWTHEWFVRVPPADYDGPLFGADESGWPLEDVRDGGFHECVDIEPVYINPATKAIDEDEEKNTEFRIWIEAGGWDDLAKPENSATWPEPQGGWNEFNRWTACHDYNLDCGGSTMEDALLQLAARVKFHYGDSDKLLDGVNHRTCEGQFLSENQSEWQSACLNNGDGYCESCGYEMPALEVGCWINTEYHEIAVCTEIRDDGFVSYRYSADRVTDDAPLWVAKKEPAGDVSFRRYPDDLSRHVLTLKGPYGVD